MATCPVQWWNEQRGGDPRTDQVTQEDDSDRAGIPKRKRPNRHSSPKGGTLKPAWHASAHKGEEARGPKCAKGRGPEDPLDSPKQDPSGWTARRYAAMESSSSFRQRGWHRDSWCTSTERFSCVSKTSNPWSDAFHFLSYQAREDHFVFSVG